MQLECAPRLDFIESHAENPFALARCALDFALDMVRIVGKSRKHEDGEGRRFDGTNNFVGVILPRANLTRGNPNLDPLCLEQAADMTYGCVVFGSVADKHVL